MSTRARLRTRSRANSELRLGETNRGNIDRQNIVTPGPSVSARNFTATSPCDELVGNRRVLNGECVFGSMVR